jgi:nucleolin
MKATKFSLPLLAIFQNTSAFTPLNFVSRTFMSSNVNLSDNTYGSAAINYQVYIGNLPFETEKEQLSDLVSDKANGLKNIRFLTDPEGRSRGFAYLDFVSEAEALAAVTSLAGLQFQGRALRIDYSEPRSKDARRGTPKALAYSVFVGNIDIGVTESLLREMVDEVLGADTADRIRVAVDRDTQRPKGFAHIDFKSEELARRAVAELSGIELMGRVLRIDYATSKNDGTNAGAPTGGGRGRERDFDPNTHSVFLGYTTLLIFVKILPCI